jgi:hypothetical protein
VGVGDPGTESRPPRRKSRPGEGRPAAAETRPTTPGLSTGAKIFVGAFVAVLYAVGMIMRGDIAPGIVGGILAGVLTFLVLREIELRRERRERGLRR